VISIVGISHRTTPIEVRERLALGDEERVALLEELAALPAIGEVMVISTCNRVEVVAAPRSGEDAGERRAAEAVAGCLLARVPELASHLYAHVGASAVHHLFRVTASLDSLVVGEPQILGQVKDAFEKARQADTLGSALHRVVARAIRTAKRVRSETPIGTGQVSVPSVAVDLTRQIFNRLHGRMVALVGSGEMAEQVARLLRGAGCRLVVLGRTDAKVKALAEAVGGEPWTWRDLQAALAEADVVVASTSAPGFVVDAAMVDGARRSRRGRSLFFIDLAVPRDVDPAAEELDGVFLYNIDDLSNVVAKAMSSRRRGAEQAEHIVATEASSFDRWREAEQVTPAIVALRTRFEQVFRRELERSLKGRLRHLGGEEREALERMLAAGINKVLHAPTRRLRQGAMDRDIEGPGVEQALELLESLFALGEELSEEPVSGPGALQGPVSGFEASESHDEPEPSFTANHDAGRGAAR
jgi:glutamyl-tRNA reductase